MTITIFGKKLLLIATITVLVTGLTLAATFDDAEAHDEEDTELNISDFECDESFGSFYDPTGTGVVNTGSLADCTLIGEAGLASNLQVTAGADDGCVGLASIDDSFLVNEDGFITFSTSGTQCFFDETGTALTADPTGFCGPGGEGKAFTSILTGTYTMTGGLVDGERVIGGSGTVDSTADHCAGTSAPFGNSGTTTIEGTIETVDEEDD